MIKKVLPFLVMAIILRAFAGCGGDFRRVEERLDAFSKCIGPEASHLFDAKQDSERIALITMRLITDTLYYQKFAELKATDAIDLFSTEEVVSFYRQYFADVIEREKSIN